MPVESKLSDQEITARVAEHLKREALMLAGPRLSNQEVSDCRRRIIELKALGRPKSMVHPAIILPHV